MTMKYERYSDGEVFATDGVYAVWFYRNADRTWKWEVTSSADPHAYESSFKNLKLKYAKEDAAEAVERMKKMHNEKVAEAMAKDRFTCY